MTVQKRGNKWYCRFQIDGIRYYRSCKGATDERSALKCETIIKSEIMRGYYNFGESTITPKLQDLVKIHLEYSKINKRSYKNDIHSTKLFLKYWGNCDLKSITPQSIESFKAHIKLERDNKNATINRHLEILKKMFNIAIDNNMLEKNPMRSVKKLKENNYKIRFLTKNEEERLFEAINYHYEVIGRDRQVKDFYPYKHLEGLIVCALQTGMRRGEIFNLKKSCVDLKTGYIELLETKSNKVRKIPISKKLYPILDMQMKDPCNNSEYVFINEETGTKYNDIKCSFHSLLKKAEIVNFRFHDFRHTVATRMVESGVDLIVVQEILGHASVQTTMRYAHPVPERKQKAINCL